MKVIITLILIFSAVNIYGQFVILSGYISEEKSKENLPYATVQSANDLKSGATSNAYGFYSFPIQANVSTTIVFSHLGYERVLLEIKVSSDTTINIALAPSNQLLKEVIIDSEEMMYNSLHHQTIQTDLIRQTPTLLGEKDVFKTLQLLPGVQRGIEGSNTFYVRGGGGDQNLVIVDDATIYNANHIFGFVSTVNTDAMKRVDFYKGSFPARYGGRIASVTDIQLKEGNREKTKVEGGIGTLSARLTIEGPLLKKKSSFLLSSRRSFIDLITKPFMPASNEFGYQFYDVNLKANFDLGQKDRLYFSGFIGGDKLDIKEKITKQQSTTKTKTELGWINRNASVRWNHLFSNKLFLNTSVIHSHYNFFFTDTYNRSGSNANYTHTKFNSRINDYTIKSDLDYFHSAKHTFKAGLALTYHVFTPRQFYSKNEALAEEERTKQIYKTQEASLYAEDYWEISKAILLDFGLRTTHFITKENSYTFLEPRVQFYAKIFKDLNFNAGYTRSNQFLHLLSNTGVGLPTDLWVPATAKAPPQQGDQFSAGLSRSFNKSTYLISIETYRRWMRNIIAYKPDAVFLNTSELSNEFTWEDNIASGIGESYGTEFLFEKKQGKITGRVAYTVSWVVHQFDEINNGKRFFPRHDSRNNIVLFCHYKISDKINISANWLYSTGNALTVPQAYYYGNVAIGNEFRNSLMPTGSVVDLVTEEIDRLPYSGSVNSFRGEAYHRLDLSVQLHKKKKHYERFWEFGLFNAYNRKNPYYYYLEKSNDYVNNGQRIDLKKKSLFSILPSISYNLKF
jgi:hypothetical protein